MFVSCACIFHECIQSGVHVTLELAASSHAWRLPVLVDLQKKQGLFTAITRGCRVGLRDKDSRLMHEGWRLLTTCSRLAQIMDMPCTCPKHVRHGRCEGPDANRSSRYTSEYVRKASQTICQELNYCSVLEECRGISQLPEWFGMGSRCACRELEHHGNSVECGECFREVLQGSSEGVGGPEAQASEPQAQVCSVTTSSSSRVVGESDKQATLKEAPTMPEVEARANGLLQNQDFSWKALEEVLGILGQLPNGRPRRMLRGAQGKSYVFGLYTYGSQHGITNRSRDMPQTTRYVNHFLRKHLGPKAQWTSFAFNYHPDPQRSAEPPEVPELLPRGW